MPKERANNYFSMLEGLAKHACDAAVELEKILKGFDAAQIDANKEILHQIEHAADDKKHELVEKLVKEFITPIEREDIMAITNEIDDVTDAVEDVLLKIYMFNIETIRPDAVGFAGIIRTCCEKLLHVFQEFDSFRKSKALHTSIIELNRLEEEGDALYISAMRKLYTTEKDAIRVMAWTEIFYRMEKVCDTCEHVADLVEHVVMKNT